MGSVPCLLHSLGEEPDLLTDVSSIETRSSTDISPTEGDSSPAKDTLSVETAGNELGAARDIPIPRVCGKTWCQPT